MIEWIKSAFRKTSDSEPNSYVHKLKESDHFAVYNVKGFGEAITTLDHLVRIGLHPVQIELAKVVYGGDFDVLCRKNGASTDAPDDKEFAEQDAKA